MNRKIKIILADDSELFRKSLVSLFKTNGEFEIIGEASNGRELIEQLKAIQPDIVLLDVEMPIMNGKMALEIIRKRFPEIKVIILSFHSEPNLTADFMTRGASCFLAKNCTVEIMYEAIRTVHKNGYYFDQSTSKAILNTLLKDKNAAELHEEITFNQREKEILQSICDGKTNKEIATNLNLSASTIDFHRGRIYTKANCNNVTELLKFALKKGFVELF